MANKQRERNSSIELLRILAGMAVIILHFNYGSVLAIEQTTGLTHYILLVFESIYICAVNVFIFISGYFGAKSRVINLSKLIKLLIQTSIFNLIANLVVCLLQGQWSDKGILFSILPINYYVILYVSLMLVAPFINIVIENLTNSGLVKLLCISLGLFSIYPTLIDVLEEVTGLNLMGLSSISLDGSGAGYTIVNFVLIYMVAAILKKIEFIEKYSLKKWIVIYLVSIVMIYIWRLILPDTAYSYSNFVMIIETIAVVAIFEKIRLRSRMINMLAPASFTCFLCHGTILMLIKDKFNFNYTTISVLGCMIVLVVEIYLLSFVIMIAWNVITRWAYKMTIDRIPVIEVNENA